jgi:predicted nucleotidyltransferase
MLRPSSSLSRQDPKVAKRVESCVKKLIKAFKPEKIILFGSYARGETVNSNTLDLMIIADTDLRFFDRIKKALKSCSGGEPAIEPLVYTPKEFDHLLSQGEGFLEDALEEGIVVYDKGDK